MSARLVRWLAALAVAFAALATAAWWRSGTNGSDGSEGADGGLFDGLYFAYFEQSEFRDCTGRLATPAWLQANAAFAAAARPFGTPDPAPDGPHRQQLRVRFRGRLETSPSNGAGFGHLSSYRAQVTVTELLALSPGGSCDVTPAPVR